MFSMFSGVASGHLHRLQEVLRGMEPAALCRHHVVQPGLSKHKALSRPRP